MTRFTRNRGSKHLRARGPGGRFKRASVGDLGLSVCKHCSRFYEAYTYEESGSFVTRTSVDKCPHCGTGVTTPHVGDSDKS